MHKQLSNHLKRVSIAIVRDSVFSGRLLRSSIQLERAAHGRISNRDGVAVYAIFHNTAAYSSGLEGKAYRVDVGIGCRGCYGGRRRSPAEL